MLRCVRNDGANVSGLTVLAAVFLLLLAVFARAAPAFPPLAGRVTDAANVISAATRAQLETKLRDLEDKSGIQLVVATIPSLAGSDVESYANGLFRAWKLGEVKKNNGVLFLVAPNDRKMRIEAGYGLEGVLTDALSKIILTAVVAPRFKAGDFSGGIERGAEAVIEVLSGDKEGWTKRAKAAESPEALIGQLLPFIIIALFIFIFINMAMNARGPSRRYRSYRRGGAGPAIIFPPSDSPWGGSSSSGSSSSGSSWGGDSGGSSWGGGGGGDSFSGGGGSSGGGGASGDW